MNKTSTCVSTGPAQPLAETTLSAVNVEAALTKFAVFAAARVKPVFKTRQVNDANRSRAQPEGQQMFLLVTLAADAADWVTARSHVPMVFCTGGV